RQRVRDDAGLGTAQRLGNRDREQAELPELAQLVGRERTTGVALGGARQQRALGDVARGALNEALLVRGFDMHRDGSLAISGNEWRAWRSGRAGPVGARSGRPLRRTPPSAGRPLKSETRTRATAACPRVPRRA